MGTIGYMAPEQVRGKAVDGRADLFAFGAVLYEMLTGSCAFQRETPADTMTAILKEDPPELASVRSDLPPALDRIVRHCLEKNPAERFQSARDVAFALEALSGSAATTVVAAQSGATARTRRGTSARELAAWVLALAGIVAAGVAVALARSACATGSRAVQSSDRTSGAALNVSVAISPDGQAMVLWVTPSKDSRLLLRRLDATDMVPLPGTESGASPFWSPDSHSIGFIADRTLKRFDLATSSVRPIAQLPQPFILPAWGRDGTILLSSMGLPINRLSETGGPPQPLGVLDKAANEAAQLRPVFLLTAAASSISRSVAEAAPLPSFWRLWIRKDDRRSTSRPALCGRVTTVSSSGGQMRSMFRRSPTTPWHSSASRRSSWLR